MEREREEKWKKMEALRQEREGGSETNTEKSDENQKDPIEKILIDLEKKSGEEATTATHGENEDNSETKSTDESNT